MKIPRLQRSYELVLGWSAAVVLTAISTRLFERASELFFSIFNKSIHVDFVLGIIGIIAFAGAVALAVILILYYTSRLRVEKIDTTVDVYSKKNIELNKFLLRAKKGNLHFWNNFGTDNTEL